MFAENPALATAGTVDPTATAFGGQHFDITTGGYVYDNPNTPLYYNMSGQPPSPPTNTPLSPFNQYFLDSVRQQSDQQNQTRQASLDRVAADPAGYAAFNESFLQGVRQQSDRDNATRQASLDQYNADPVATASFNQYFLESIRQQSDQQNATRQAAIGRNNADPNNRQIAPDFQGQHFDPMTGGYVYNNPNTPLYYGQTGPQQQMAGLGYSSGNTGMQSAGVQQAFNSYGQMPSVQLPTQPTQQQTQQLPQAFTGQPQGNAGPTAPGNWGMDAAQALNSGGRANYTVPAWLKPMFGGQF